MYIYTYAIAMDSVGSDRTFDGSHNVSSHTGVIVLVNNHLIIFDFAVCYLVFYQLVCGFVLQLTERLLNCSIYSNII